MIHARHLFEHLLQGFQALVGYLFFGDDGEGLRCFALGELHAGGGGRGGHGVVARVLLGGFAHINVGHFAAFNGGGGGFGGGEGGQQEQCGGYGLRKVGRAVCGHDSSLKILRDNVKTEKFYQKNANCQGV